MIIYSGGDNHLSSLEWLRRLGFGQMKSPGIHFQPAKVRWVLDNGAWPLFVRKEKLPYDKAMGPAFYKLLHRVEAGTLRAPDFAILPDIVAGGKRSLRLSLRHVGLFPEEIKPYLAVQDGMLIKDIRNVLVQYPVDSIAGLFVGGSTEWKHQTAAYWADLAHSYGRKCHVGRIGMAEDIARMLSAGVDSIDSTSWRRHGSYYHIRDGFELHAKRSGTVPPALRKMRRIPLPV